MAGPINDPAPGPTAERPPDADADSSLIRFEAMFFGVDFGKRAEAMADGEEKKIEAQLSAKPGGGRRAVTDLTTYLVIGAGGFVGANARYILGHWALLRWGEGFPYGTFIINVAGCFILGMFGTLSEKLAWNDYWRFAIAVGFVGAFTTFSTFEYESFLLVSHGEWARAGANIIGSVAVGFVAVYLGVIIARLLLRGYV